MSNVYDKLWLTSILSSVVMFFVTGILTEWDASSYRSWGWQDALEFFSTLLIGGTAIYTAVYFLGNIWGWM